jgi:hypothetical protein
MATSVNSAGLKAAADKVIIAAKPAIEFIKLFSTDLSVDSAKKGSAVAVEVLSAVAGDFGASNGYTKSTNKIAPAQVSLSKHKKSTFVISDVNALEDELSAVWSNLAPVAGSAVGKQVAADAVAALNAGTATETVTSAVTSLADFAAIRAGVAENFDPADCVLILTPAAYANLLVALPQNILGGDSAIRMGQIGAFLGFKAVIESANVTGANGYVVPTGALAIAARTVQPVKMGGNLIEFGTITDEASGFVFGQRVVVDADQGTCAWTVDCLYGAELTKTSDNGAPGFVKIAAA